MAVENGYFQLRNAIEQRKQEVAGADADLADSIDYDSITDMGDVPQIELPANETAGNVGDALPVETVRRIYEEYDTPRDAQVKVELQGLPDTLNALRNSLNVNPFEMKSLAEQSGLSYAAIDSDPAFARRKAFRGLGAAAIGGFVEDIARQEGMNV